MNHAFTILGLVVLIVFVGAFVVFNKKADAPEALDLEKEKSSMSLTLTSPAFEEGSPIPSRFTCDAENISVPLTITGVPEGTQSLVLVMDDPDIPQEVKEARGIEKFNHWAVYNIPPDTTVLKEGEVIGSQGLNSRGEEGYAGPCPPDAPHRYFFRLYALSGTLNFIKAPTLDELEEAAKGSMIEATTLMGTYNRINNI